jgi:CRP-like cAMP-binding protein
MSEQSTNTKTARRRRRFDPALFFETAAKGRTISKHRKSEIIFSQGDEANVVFYIKKGKVKVPVPTSK